MNSGDAKFWARSCLQKKAMKLGDCLIASQIPKDMILVTFDKEFDKIKKPMDETSLYFAIKDYVKSDDRIEKIFDQLENRKKDRRAAVGNPQVIRTRQ